MKKPRTIYEAQEALDAARFTEGNYTTDPLALVEKRAAWWRAVEHFAEAVRRVERQKQRCSRCLAKVVQRAEAEG